MQQRLGEIHERLSGIQEQIEYQNQRQRRWDNLALTPERTREMQDAFIRVYQNSDLFYSYRDDYAGAWDFVRVTSPRCITILNGDPNVFMEELRNAGFTKGIINKFIHN